MWQLWLQSEKWRTLPSDILSIEDAYVAYCINEAVFWFGTEVERRVDKARESKGKTDTGKKQEQRANAALRKALGLRQQFASTDSLKG